LISGRGKRVAVYTAALLCAPAAAMPFARGTRGFAAGLAAWGLSWALASFYVLRGELKSRGRDLLGHKLIAASLITLLFGASLFAGSVVYLSVN
jgi:hypothetical protein